MKSSLLILVTALVSAPAALAQGEIPLIPFAHTGDVFVTDSTSDNVVRLIDLNLDGDFNDAGEVTVFYDETLGGTPLGNNNSIAFALDGGLFLCDTTEDKVFRLLDADGDGACHTAGEITVFFDGDPSINLSALEMVSPNSVVVDAFGKVWIAEANNGGGGIDSIVVLEDLTFDGDANDAGEARRYFEPPTSGSTGDSIPNDLVVGADGHVYYVEGGSTGFVPKDVFRLDDANGDGTIDPATEVASFFSAPAGAATSFFWSLAQDASGYFFVADTGNEVIWRFRDENGDDVIDNATEAVTWWQATGSSFVWDLGADSNGGLLACESQDPDRMLYLFDANSDGVVDPVTEVVEVYSELVSATDISNPRGLAIERLPTLLMPSSIVPGTPFPATVFATEGDGVQTFWSLSTVAPFPLAPFGTLLISPGPGSGLLYSGISGPDGVHATGVTVPPLPGISGVTFFTQCFVGKPDRLQLGTSQATLIL